MSEESRLGNRQYTNRPIKRRHEPAIDESARMLAVRDDAVTTRTKTKFPAVAVNRTDAVRLADQPTERSHVVSSESAIDVTTAPRLDSRSVFAKSG